MEEKNRVNSENDLKAAAREYFDSGHNVIPVKGKEPLIQWKQLQKIRQNIADFERLPWNRADGFAIIGGSEDKCGDHFCAVDLDVRGVSNEAIETGKKLILKLPDTKTDKTISGGLHLYFSSKKNPRTIGGSRSTTALELLGKAKLIIVAPSRGYTKIKDRQPTLVGDLEGLFLEILRTVGEVSVQTDSTSKLEPYLAADNKRDNRSFWFGREDLASKPFAEADPPCLREIMKGVDEGIRNEALIRLASYFVNFRQLEPQKALRKVIAWNKFNRKPLDEKELKKTFLSALRGNYNYSCHDNILKQYCNPAFYCSFRSAEPCTDAKETGTSFDEVTENSIQTEVRRIMESENQLEALKQHLDNVIVCEDKNKRVITVLLSGSKYADTAKLSIIVLKGDSRGGKSSLANSTLYGYAVKKVGRFTRHGLDYADLQDCDVLYIQELGKMDEEKTGLSTLKFLGSDDKGYVVEYPVRDEQTGIMRTESRVIPPLMVISTTTRISTEVQFENRAWLLTIDESAETSLKVLRWKAERKGQEDEKMLGIRKITDYEFSKEVLGRYVKQIKPHKIIVPFRNTVTKMFKPECSLRIRGDIDKIYTFIELYANFNLKRLHQLEIAGDPIYAVTPEVAVEALELIKGVISQMLAGIEPRTKQILETLNRIEVLDGFTDPKMTGEAKLPIMAPRNREGCEIDRKLRGQIARRLNVSEDTVRKRLNALCEHGYLGSDDERGRKGKTFTLLFDVSQILKKLNEESGISMSPSSLIPEMEKEAQEWLSSKCGIYSTMVTAKKGELSSAEQVQNYQSVNQELSPNSKSSENQNGFAERDGRNTEKQENRNDLGKTTA